VLGAAIEVAALTAVAIEDMTVLFNDTRSRRIRAFLAAVLVAGAVGGPGAAMAVTTAQDAAGGCDGIKNGKWGFHVASGETNPWWQVDLGKAYRLDRIVVYNRIDSSCAPRTSRLRILVAGPDGKKFRQVYQHNGKPFYGVNGKPLVVSFKGKSFTGRIVRLQIPGRCSFALDEVEVYAADDPKKNIALNKPADQISVSPYSFPGTMDAARYASSTGRAVRAPKPKAARGGGSSPPAARDVFARGLKLAARLKPKADPRRLNPLVLKLKLLQSRLAKPDKDDDVRKQTLLEARRIVRKIAFCSPLLDMDKILFIKRHDPGGPFHMCDQYYGCNARPGGGLFVLADPFSEKPKLTNLLENSVVRKGRLKGKKLVGGSFLSPELSYDGKTILFAYSEAKARKTYQWSPTYSYHIFKCNSDGSGLVQLTDGKTDDFDPCFLPNGRVVFVTLRRGGYLRCGRHCPVYTMFSMADDGSGIRPFSYHETHEWHPSVNNDGMVVYTRWDYVDRDTNIAHHIWTTYPDGRDPRSFHGNYPVRRQDRPWMEMSIRAIPGSDKYVATTGAHHGHAFGSLVLIDPNVEDDNAKSQIERLTPDTPFAEAEGGRGGIRGQMRYGTAWPLSEDDYLCVYDAAARNRGIYWIDRYGNRELLYRDPKISCLSPIPLRPRRRPPIIPDQTAYASPGPKQRQATIAVMNVYDADFAWPAGTKIKALRVIQVLPKTTAPPNNPRIGVANQTNARVVLGTAPVESDGSVYFEAPVGKAIYFQALDERGLAVQSMRSATYVHPGEALVCHGCHESKHRPPRQRPSARVPLAMRRAASKLQPDVDGSKPFSYPRLVQPVLNRACVPCHTKNKAKKAPDLTAAVAGKYGWTRSYTSLAAKYGFYFHVTNGSINTGVHGGSRTIPGKFGAKASGLYKLLTQGSHKNRVKLSGEDLHRITLWLDCNSEFYGSYHDIAAQARGEIVQPTLD